MQWEHLMPSQDPTCNEVKMLFLPAFFDSRRFSEQQTKHKLEMSLTQSQSQSLSHSTSPVTR